MMNDVSGVVESFILGAFTRGSNSQSESNLRRTTTTSSAMWCGSSEYDAKIRKPPDDLITAFEPPTDLH